MPNDPFKKSGRFSLFLFWIKSKLGNLKEFAKSCMAWLSPILKKNESLISYSILFLIHVSVSKLLFEVPSELNWVLFLGSIFGSLGFMKLYGNILIEVEKIKQYKIAREAFMASDRSKDTR